MSGKPAGAHPSAADLARLEAAARAAQERAYAPYSRFRVGAAVLTASGEIFGGANVENASYGLSVCAERNAIMAAALDGHRVIEAICVASDVAPPASPCGMCRQTMLEFAPDPELTRVVAIGAHDTRMEWTVSELIPYGFTGSHLSPGAAVAVAVAPSPRRSRRKP